MGALLGYTDKLSLKSESTINKGHQTFCPWLLGYSCTIFHTVPAKKTVTLQCGIHYLSCEVFWFSTPAMMDS